MRGLSGRGGGRGGGGLGGRSRMEVLGGGAGPPGLCTDF